AKLKLQGSNLLSLIRIKSSNTKLDGELLSEPAPKAGEVWIKVSAASDLTRGSYDLSVEGPGGESGKLTVYVDDVPQLSEAEGKSATNRLANFPMAFWGTLDPMGDTDALDFDARTGQTLLFDLAAKSLGSKANAVLTLSDASGKVLANNNDFDGGTDPLLAYTFSADGRYTVRISDLMLGGSKEHSYH